MGWFAIGSFPHGLDAEEPEWLRQVVAWCQSYLEFCCDSPAPGSYIDGIATEEEIAQGTSVSGEIPLGMALFYDESLEDEAAHYVDKCRVAYHRFCTAVDWVACHPTTLVSLFERLGYDVPVRRGGPGEPPGPPAPLTLEKNAFQDVLRAINAAQSNDCKLELVRLPPLLLEPEQEPNWRDWVVTWIRAYVDYTCGAPPSGTRVTPNWDTETGWSNTQTERPAKVLCGWGLDWDGVEPPPKAHDFAERFRMACYRLLLHVDWHQLDGATLRACFAAQGYNDYRA